MSRATRISVVPTRLGQDVASSKDPEEQPEKAPAGFAYTVRGRGEVAITHNGKAATQLRGRAAARFLSDVENDDPQSVMARVTGNYKRGNERQASLHPRNRNRDRR